MAKASAPDRQEIRYVGQAQAGDTVAMDWLIKRYQRAAYALALYHVANHHLAEDVVQEALRKASRKLKQLKDPQRFRSWLMSIVRTTALRFLQSESRHSQRVDPDADLDSIPAKVQGDVIEEAERTRLWSCVGKLPPASRETILCYFMDDMSIPEIADKAPAAIATVKARFYYALRQLRIRMKLGVCDDK